MVLIDDMDDTYPWAFAYCVVKIDSPLTQGVGAFYISVPANLPAGRIWLTRYGTYSNLTGIPYLVFDILQSQRKRWNVTIKDKAGNTQTKIVDETGGHITVYLPDFAPVDLNNIDIISIGAIAPLDTTYTAIIDNLRTETVLPSPIEYPLQVSVSPESVAIYIGQTVTITASPYSGLSPYTIEWVDNVTQQVIGTGATFVFTGTTVGTYEIYARATDSVGSTATSKIVTIKVTEAPPPPPPTEPTPPNTSHISVVDNEVKPHHVALWYPWFLDTSSGWLPKAGEKWVDSNYTRWSPESLRAILRDIRDVFKCNMVRVFFWADWVLTNSNATMSPLYPTSEIGNRDALHTLCQIANEEGLDVELRMWDWNPTEGKSGNPLKAHTTTEFINAWVQIAKWFSVYPNVCFNLFDEANSSGISWADWNSLAYNTIMQIRLANVGHVIYVHWGFSGGEGIDWIRQFSNHYQVAFSRHEYIYHGTTEAMHQDTINIKNEGYPITVTASGVYNENPTEIETYKRWWKELLDNRIGISFYTYGRPNTMGFRIQQDTPFPSPPNSVGETWIETVAFLYTPPIPSISLAKVAAFLLLIPIGGIVAFKLIKKEGAK